MNPRSLHRTIVLIALIYVVFMIVPHLSTYVQLVAGGAHRGPMGLASSQTSSGPRQKKLSGPELESLFRRANRLGPDAQLRCEPARDWDYVCSYLPTALPSPKRLHFGVNVDLKRWVKISSVVPVGTPVPAPTPGR